MPSTLIFAHRGANREAPENTRSAFDRALCYQIDGMETDVQLTRDEVTVLWHDRFLNKVGLPDKHIDDFDLAELSTFNFAQHFSSAETHESIVSLQDYLAAYRHRCHLLIEIKNREWERPERQQIKVRQTLERIGAVTDNNIIVSSFHLDSLIYARQSHPGFPLVVNCEEDQSVADTAQLISAHPFLHGVCLHIATLDQSMVELLRSQGKSIAVYTCNTVAEIGRALALGVDILISDIPQKALQMRDL
jgi:glycerophosphoryl diester phosphodiesterase